MERHGIAYHEKKLGQLFCDRGSRGIIEMLLTECSEAGVEIYCGSVVRSVAKKDDYKGKDYFEVETNNETFVSQSLVVATGGLSISPLGATDFGYRLARQFGLTIQEPRPALVPFALSPQAQRELTTLSGVSIDASVSCGGQEFRENILITHRGLS